jgi:Protein of unknown function (DUF3011)
MKPYIRCLAVLFAVLIPGLARAQNAITCSSAPGGGRTYCAADTRGGVTLVAPRGARVPCQQGVQWGFDAQGIWVQGGCSADFRVKPYRGGAWWWDSGPGVRPAPWKGTGACFYRNVGFDGAYFCMGRGEKIDRLPSGFNNAISSIQVVRARSVVIYSQNNFQGYSSRVPDSIPNLKQWRIPSTGKSWNNRISAIRVD